MTNLFIDPSRLKAEQRKAMADVNRAVAGLRLGAGGPVPLSRQPKPQPRRNANEPLAR